VPWTRAKTPYYFQLVWIKPAFILFCILLSQYATKKAVDIYRIRKEQHVASQLFYRGLPNFAADQ
jgi:hypothetical protein